MPPYLCPACRLEMKKRQQPDYIYFFCKGCKSYLVKKDALDQVVPGLVDDEELNRSYDEKDRRPKRFCPECFDQEMVKVAIYANLDVVLDYCSQCSFIYFDRDEFDEIIKANSNEQYREFVDEHLVKIDTLEDVFFNEGFAGKTRLEHSYLISISVFFKSPLDIGLFICGETKIDKFLKFIGKFNTIDLEVGDPIIDEKYIIQADNREVVVSLLNDKSVNKMLRDMAYRGFRLYSQRGMIKIYDTHINYLEGPYRKHYKGIINKRKNDFKSAKTIQTQNKEHIEYLLLLAQTIWRTNKKHKKNINRKK